MLRSGNFCSAVSRLRTSASAGQLVCFRARYSAQIKASALNEPLTVQTPLCQRPSVSVIGVGALLDWKRKTEADIAEIGDAFNRLDDGPTAEDLITELGWTLEDVVGEVQFSSDRQWEACTWKQLQPEIAAASRRNQSTDSWLLKLRLSVPELEDMWSKRLQDRVPYQYLTNTAHWYTYVLAVAPGVLIPRPETEIFPELVQEAVARQASLATLPWVDLGTGSGVIAIATADVLRKRNKAAQVYAVDISPTAAAYATRNIAATGLSQYVQVLEGSWFEPVMQHMASQQQPLLLGGVVSNPPYIPRDEMATLQKEVGKHEPWSALDGGPGPGLDSLMPICDGAAEFLAPGGFLALETAGGQQALALCDMLQKWLDKEGHTCFECVEVRNDWYGKGRFVIAQRRQK